MNETLTKDIREKIKRGLEQLDEGHRNLFKRMYSLKGVGVPIDEVVDSIPDEKLDWAFSQVERSLNKKIAEMHPKVAMVISDTENYGCEEDDVCGRDNCKGIMTLYPAEGCSCHVSPPCSACENNKVKCNICGLTEDD